MDNLPDLRTVSNTNHNSLFQPDNAVGVEAPGDGLRADIREVDGVEGSSKSGLAGASEPEPLLEGSAVVAGSSEGEVVPALAPAVAFPEIVAGDLPWALGTGLAGPGLLAPVDGESTLLYSMPVLSKFMATNFRTPP